MTSTSETSIAKRLASDIREVALRAHSEEDLRIGIEELLKPALKELGVEVAPRYEKSYAILRGGRSDAVYGHLVIEYERVGTLAKTRGVNHAAEQLHGYLQAEAHRIGGDSSLHRSVGVGLDGEHIFFVRYRQAKETQPQSAADEFKILGPYPITEESIETFLLYLRALRRRPLS